MKQGDQIEVKGSSVFLLKGEGLSMLLPFPHHTLSQTFSHNPKNH